MTDVYGEQLAAWEKAGHGRLPVCMAKTQYSFSTDATARGAPSGHSVNIREVRLAAGGQLARRIASPRSTGCRTAWSAGRMRDSPRCGRRCWISNGNTGEYRDSRQQTNGREVSEITLLLMQRMTRKQPTQRARRYSWHQKDSQEIGHYHRLLIFTHSE